MTTRVLLALIALAVPGCKQAKPDPDPVDAGKFADRIEARDRALVAIDPPDETPQLRWDFSRYYNLSFDMDMELADDDSDRSKSIRGEGRVRSLGDHTASLEWRGGWITRFDGESHTDEAAGSRTSTMTEDGMTTNDNSLSMRSFVPLPEGRLDVGQTQTVPASFGSLGGKPSMGTVRVTLAGYVECGERRCAKLRTALSIPAMTQEGDSGERATHTASGVGLVLFDYEAGQPFASYLAAKMELREETSDGDLVQKYTLHYFARMERN